MSLVSVRWLFFSALIHFCQMTETSRYNPQSMNYKVIATLLHTHIYTETVLMELFTRFFRGTQNEKLRTMFMLLFSIQQKHAVNRSYRGLKKFLKLMLVHHVGSFLKPSLCIKQAKIILGETAAHMAVNAITRTCTMTKADC